MPAPARGSAAAKLIAVLALVLLALYFLPQLRRGFSGPPAQPRAILARGDLAADESTTIAIFEAASPSVVYITISGRVMDMWTRNVFEVPKGTGSGFVWDDDGHVVTNYHVIQGAERAQVRLSTEASYDAVLVGASPEHDLAVLRIVVSADPPPPLPLGTSADLKVGQTVLAIGNPFGLDHTLTTGVISALDRTIEGERGRSIEHLIQTDAAINPGNSGGPLIDSAGRLIGINTAIYSPSGAYAGIGFAVPVDTVNRIVPLLIANGRYVRPVLGIQGDDEVSKQLLDEVGLAGVLVLRVGPGTPAEKIGLQPTQLGRDGEVLLGDMIVAMDGKAIADLGDLTDALDLRKVGDEVELTVWRNGAERKLKATLAAP